MESNKTDLNHWNERKKFFFQLFTAAAIADEENRPMGSEIAAVRRNRRPISVRLSYSLLHETERKIERMLKRKSN